MRASIIRLRRDVSMRSGRFSETMTAYASLMKYNARPLPMPAAAARLRKCSARGSSVWMLPSHMNGKGNSQPILTLGSTSI